MTASVSVLIVFSEAIYCPMEDSDPASSCSTVWKEGMRDVLEPMLLTLILFLVFALESLSLRVSP